ncbi:D-galacturonic acid binding lectin [Plakobranchus ocellatus]|uniref:D-galacturonic acid binding lectin n=1 Tax=Plakobranchus ocellatus TaxID=259542 RepID=A0AAV4DCK6_9GAST|nr:D-galacturonic acid binding lectin [Plakobranchus ocellatus]
MLPQGHDPVIIAPGHQFTGPVSGHPFQCITLKLESIHFRYKSIHLQVAQKVLSMIALVKYSVSHCTFTHSYGFNGADVWVKSGCRALFKICFVPRPSLPVTKEITCASYHFRRVHCNVGRRIISVIVKKKFSLLPCIFGLSYKFSGSVLEVFHSCRAVFLVKVY